jgi:hypothetical protein
MPTLPTTRQPAMRIIVNIDGWSASMNKNLLARPLIWHVRHSGMNVLLQPERRRNQQHAGDHGIDADRLTSRAGTP